MNGCYKLLRLTFRNSTGEHLLLTHQIFNSTNIVHDTRRARDELLKIFPQLKEEDELCVHTFHKDWPVNYACQGSDFSNFSSIIPNLFFVGNGYKGNDGWMIFEGVAHAVKQVVGEITVRQNLLNLIIYNFYDI